MRVYTIGVHADDCHSRLQERDTGNRTDSRDTTPNHNGTGYCGNLCNAGKHRACDRANTGNYRPYGRNYSTHRNDSVYSHRTGT